MALINLRNALMGGKRLPYDAELEFLESTGTQWIDTGVNVSTVSNNLRVRGLVKFTNLSSGEHDILGSGNLRTPTMGRNGAQYFMWAEISTSWYPASCDTNWHELDFSFSNPSGRTFSVDGNSYSTSSSNKFFGTNLYLFASGPNRYPVSCQIEHIQIFIDNILVRDYIPVRKGTVGYLYDRVSGRLFGNAGTGDFVLGQDVVPVSFVDGEGYNSSGAITTAQGLSRIDDYLPVIGGHSITFNYGGAANANCSLIVYNSSKTRIDYWSAAYNNERTITMNANGAFARFAVYEESKQTAFLRDNTTGEYIMINGKRIVE